MRELVAKSTTVATAPVVYYPMFSQQSINANWTAGHVEIEWGPVELMTGLKGCTSSSANWQNQCLDGGAKVHLTTVQIRSGLISLSLFPTHASLCFHSCVFTTQECIRRLLIWETGEDLREHPNWSCQWTQYLYNNVVASCQSFSSSFKFDASN